jgi:hypothetical protein
VGYGVNRETKMAKTAKTWSRKHIHDSAHRNVGVGVPSQLSTEFFQVKICGKEKIANSIRERREAEPSYVDECWKYFWPEWNLVNEVVDIQAILVNNEEFA